MIRVLFVDDDNNLLQGLRRGLRKQLSVWTMDFVDSPQKALEMFDSQSFDVVVSDLQMPGMNGIELLKEVSERNPEVVPIILSGQVNKSLLMHSLRANAQVLLKPCKMEDLISAIERSHTLRMLMRSDNVQRVVSKLTELPSLSKTHTKLIEALDNDKTPLSKIIKLLQEDVSITAKVMQLANSAFFGHTRVAQLENAIKILGLTHIRLLVLASDIFLKIDHRKGANVDISSLIRHSTNVGRYSGHIAKALKLSPSECEAAHVAGLLHDIGKLILLKDMPKEMSRIAKYRDEKNLPEYEIESEILGCTHSEVGAYILGVWQLPDVILEAVVFHHHPLQVTNSQPSVISSVFFANTLEHRLHNEKVFDCEKKTFEDYAAQLEVEQQLAQWEKTIEKSLTANDQQEQ